VCGAERDPRLFAELRPGQALPLVERGHQPADPLLRRVPVGVGEAYRTDQVLVGQLVERAREEAGEFGELLRVHGSSVCRTIFRIFESHWSGGRMTTDQVFAVHTSKPDSVSAVEVVFRSEREARAFAADRSTDDRVLSASVTSYAVGVLGSRRPVCWFQYGKEQAVRFDRPGIFGC